MTQKMGSLVSPQWLAAHLDDDNLVVLDTSWYKPQYGRVGWIEYRDRHIPGAGFYDLDEVVDLEDDRPHMLPPPDEFAGAVGELGIDNDTTVILYDSHEKRFYSSGRVWWVFRVMGHKNVAVLEGGFPGWLAGGYPVESGLPEDPDEKSYTAQFHPGLVLDQEEVAAAMRSGTPQIVDAREPDLFAGRLAEVAPGLRSGRIPSSRNVWYEDLFRPDATFRSNEEVRALFMAAGVDLEKPVLTTCCSGITACILAIAMDRMGYPDIPVYDGSWSEWGMDHSLEMETG